MNWPRLIVLVRRGLAQFRGFQFRFAQVFCQSVTFVAGTPKAALQCGNFLFERLEFFFVILLRERDTSEEYL